MVSGVRLRAQSQSAHRGTALLSFGPVRPRAKPKRWGADNTAWFPAFVPAHKAKAQHLPHFLRSHTPFVPARSQSGLLTTRCSEGTFIPAREAMPLPSQGLTQFCLPFIPAREAMPADTQREESREARSSPRARQCRTSAGPKPSPSPFIPAREAMPVLHLPSTDACFHPRARQCPAPSGSDAQKSAPADGEGPFAEMVRNGICDGSVCGRPGRPAAAACAIAGLLRADAGFVPSFPLPNSCR